MRSRPMIIGLKLCKVNQTDPKYVFDRISFSVKRNVRLTYSPVIDNSSGPTFAEALFMIFAGGMITFFMYVLLKAA